jgi:hypothetical protein
MSFREFHIIRKNYLEKYEIEKNEELKKRNLDKPITELNDSQRKITETLNRTLLSKYKNLLKNERFKHIVSDIGIVENVIRTDVESEYNSRVILKIQGNNEEVRIMFNSYDRNHLERLSKGEKFEFRGVTSSNQFGGTFHFGVNNLWFDEIKSKPKWINKLSKMFS